MLPDAPAFCGITKLKGLGDRINAVALDLPGHGRSPGKAFHAVPEYTRAVKVVLYTHNHVDHFRGTKACYQEGVKVIAHNDFMKEVKLQDSRGLSARLRAGAMFGVLMPLSERFPWVGTFPQVTTGRIRWEEISPDDLICPNHTFSDKFSFRLVAKFKPIQKAAAEVALPAHLAQLPYLRPYYGYLPYCVRSIYDNLVG